MPVLWTDYPLSSKELYSIIVSKINETYIMTVFIKGRHSLDEFLSGSLRFFCRRRKFGLCVIVPDVDRTRFFVVKKYLAC